MWQLERLWELTNDIDTIPNKGTHCALVTSLRALPGISRLPIFSVWQMRGRRDVSGNCGEIVGETNDIGTMTNKGSHCVHTNNGIDCC
jgi:hypothetical protein